MSNSTGILSLAVWARNQPKDSVWILYRARDSQGGRTVAYRHSQREGFGAKNPRRVRANSLICLFGSLGREVFDTSIGLTMTFTVRHLPSRLAGLKSMMYWCAISAASESKASLILDLLSAIWLIPLFEKPDFLRGLAIENCELIFRKLRSDPPPFICYRHR